MKAIGIIVGLVLYFAFAFMIAKFLALNDRFLQREGEKNDNE